MLNLIAARKPTSILIQTVLCIEDIISHIIDVKWDFYEIV